MRVRSPASLQGKAVLPAEPATNQVSERSHLRKQLKPLETEGSFIPGETEEDGLLRREYVLVGDTRAVEFNRTVDGKSSPKNETQVSYFVGLKKSALLVDDHFVTERSLHLH